MGNYKHGRVSDRGYDEGGPVFPPGAIPHTPVSDKTMPTILADLGGEIFASNQRLLEQLWRLARCNDRAFGPEQPATNATPQEAAAEIGSLQYISQQLEWRRALQSALDSELTRVERLA